MFTISNEQLDAFAGPRMADFHQRLRGHLAEHFPEHVPQDEPAWTELLDRGLHNARLYQFRTEESITIYFNVLLTLGAGFAASPGFPWAAGLLQDRDLKEKQKIRQLVAHTEEYLHLLTLPD